MMGWKSRKLTWTRTVPECTAIHCKMACVCWKGYRKGTTQPLILLVSYREKDCSDFCHYDCGCPVW